MAAFSRHKRRAAQLSPPPPSMWPPGGHNCPTKSRQLGRYGGHGLVAGLEFYYYGPFGPIIIRIQAAGITFLFDPWGQTGIHSGPAELLAALLADNPSDYPPMRRPNTRRAASIAAIVCGYATHERRYIPLGGISRLRRLCRPAEPPQCGFVRRPSVWPPCRTAACSASGTRRSSCRRYFAAGPAAAKYAGCGLSPVVTALWLKATVAASCRRQELVAA
jgi:hypothetical protein